MWEWRQPYICISFQSVAASASAPPCCRSHSQAPFTVYWASWLLQSVQSAFPLQRASWPRNLSMHKNLPEALLEHGYEIRRCGVGREHMHFQSWLGIKLWELLPRTSTCFSVFNAHQSLMGLTKVLHLSLHQWFTVGDGFTPRGHLEVHIVIHGE